MRLNTLLYRTSVTLVVVLTCLVLLAALLIGWRLDANTCDLMIPMGVSTWTNKFSWWPIGYSCVYELDDPAGPTVVPPSYALTISLAVILICGVAALWLLWRWHKRHAARHPERGQ